MIIDSHMHVGEFPMFTVSLDDSGRLGFPFHHPPVELAKVRVSGPSTDPTDRVHDVVGQGSAEVGHHLDEVRPAIRLSPVRATAPE